MSMLLFRLFYVLLWIHIDSDWTLVDAFSAAPTKIRRKFETRTGTNNNDDGATEQQQTVVVVGAGVGGLATAARIASSSSSSKVIVVEKNSFAGGRCGSFEVKTRFGTFRHERGPSLLLLPQVYRDLFQDCSGKSPEDYGLDIRQCVPAYQVVFDDGDRIELGFPKSNDQTAAAEQRSRAKMDLYEENGATKWDAYMQSTAAFLDCGLPNFIEERLDLASFPAFIREALRDWGKSWPLKPHSDVLDATFASTKMRALASFQNLYVGLEPYRNDQQFGGGVLRKTAPAVFGLLAAIELHPSNKNAGVFAPVGGFDRVTAAFQKLAEEHKVTFRFDTAVVGVESNGVVVKDANFPNSEPTLLPADVVVMNADLPYATRSILSPSCDSMPRYDWDDRFDFSSGVIAFHWSIDKVLDDLNTHNVFLVASSRTDAEDSWRVVRDPSRSDDDSIEPFNFYVHRASKTDPTAAPTGCDAILVLVPCRTLARDEDFAGMKREKAIEKYKEQFDEAVVARAKQAVLRRLGALESLQDLQTHIIDEAVDTPGNYADLYNVAAGTPFAISHGFGQLSVTRPAHESTSGNQNVLFVGASTRPGNGVPLVLLGAKQVAKKALTLLAKKGTTRRRK